VKRPHRSFYNKSGVTKGGQHKNRIRKKGALARKKNRHGSGTGANKTTNTDTAPTEKPRKTKKVYRRTKVLRTWVLPFMFLVPLSIVWLEYYIGKLIGLEDVKSVYQEHLVDPWVLLMQDLDDLRSQERAFSGSPILPSILANIAYTPRKTCPAGQRRMINVHNPLSHPVDSKTRLIPRIVHQQSKTRCLTMRVDRTTVKWAFRRWSYYIHDEESRDRLFGRYCGGSTRKCEFPLLNHIVSNCFENNRKQLRYHSLKIELWKFLNLWVFGGVFVEIGFLPAKFNPGTIRKGDDGFLLIDPDTGRLSTKMMAVPPRHPIMYYAVQTLLLNVLMDESSSSLLAGTTAHHTGSYILGQAFRMFQGKEDVGGDGKFSSGVFQGVLNRKIRVVVGNGLNIINTIDGHNFITQKENNNRNDLVVSIFSSEQDKETEYRKMGMAENAEANAENSHSEGGDDVEVLPCFGKLYHLTNVSLP